MLNTPYNKHCLVQKVVNNFYYVTRFDYVDHVHMLHKKYD